MPKEGEDERIERLVDRTVDFLQNEIQRFSELDKKSITKKYIAQIREAIYSTLGEREIRILVIADEVLKKVLNLLLPIFPESVAGVSMSRIIKELQRSNIPLKENDLYQ